MRFVVATLPDVKYRLGRDVVLSKTCALYGDETVVYSPTYLGTEPLLDFPSKSMVHKLYWLALLARDPGFVVGEKLTAEERRTRIKKAEELSESYIENLRRWSELSSAGHSITEHSDELVRIAKKVSNHAQIIERAFFSDEDANQRTRALQRASELNLIRIEQINEYPSFYYNHEKLIRDVDAALSAPDAYGALDERLTKELIRRSAVRVEKQRAVGVASEMFRRLPTFEFASFDEIVDIKKELAPFLANFRKGLIGISQQIRSTPWEKGFPHEVERELRSRVLPEIAALEDKVESNGYLKHLIHRAVTEPLVLPANSAFGALLSTTTQISTVASQVAGAIVGGGLLVSQAYKDWKEAQKENEANIFFFYYSVRKKLENRKRQT